MKTYEIIHYRFNIETIDVNKIDTTIVHADTMHVSEGNTLMFFVLSEDGSYRAIKTWHDDFWMFAEEINTDE